MSYTEQDVKGLRDALLAAKAANAKAHEATMTVFDLDFETARTAEALGNLHDAEGKLDEAIKLLDHEYDRIDDQVKEEAGR